MSRLSLSPAKKGVACRYALAAALIPCLILPAGPALALKDSQARQEIEALHNRLNQVETSMQSRQMSLSEELQSIREERVQLDTGIDENRVAIRNIEQDLEVIRIEMQENFIQFNNATESRFKATDENIGRLLKGIESLQANVQALGNSLKTMSDFEKTQEARISQTQRPYRISSRSSSRRSTGKTAGSRKILPK